MELMEHQLDAIDLLGSGKILYGGVGSGKSATVLAYYMKYEAPRHIFVFTTAKKRDTLEWEREAARFGISTEEHCTVAGMINIDSWNNIGKYLDIEDAFIILDEQRLVGHGVWVKNFLKIAKKNRWVLLSATPGDVWLDYAPVFIANGFYQNMTRFKMEHVVYEPFVKFPKVKRYLNEQKLEVLRNDILVEMPYQSHTQRQINWFDVEYDKELFYKMWKDRWNIYTDKPIKDAAELSRAVRRLVNSDASRLAGVRKMMKMHDRILIFYNFNYELDILRTLGDEIEVKEWNGHRKDPLPTGDKWLYLLQYVSGSEGWNCKVTDAMILYSLPHSYKNFKQAPGRIDRLDTPYEYLYYYIFVSNSITDRGIRRSLGSKKNFNERKFMQEMENLDLCELEEF